MESKQKASATSSVWFKSFMIFLLVIIVALSLGLTIFYFMHETEELYLDKTIISTNLNDEFDVVIIHTHPNNSTQFELKYPEEHLEKMNVSEDGLTYTFKAIAASRAGVNIELVISDAKFTSSTTCLVTIADGSAMNPFVIRTAEELAAIGSVNRPLSSCYRQVNDIDLNAYASWTPIASGDANKFSGTYNGNFCTISNLKIADNETSATKYAGLFGYVTGSVSNLKIVNANISSKAQYVGVAAGYSTGSISRVETTGYVAQIATTAASGTEASALGGVVGQVSRDGTDTTLDRCSFIGQLNKTNTFNNGSNIGGLIGKNMGGSVFNSYAKSAVISNANNVYAGGLIGYNRQTMESKGQSSETCKTNMKGNIINAYSVFDNSQLTGSVGVVSGAVVGYNSCVNGTADYAAFDDSTKNINRYAGVYYLKDDTHTASWMNGASDVTIFVNGANASAMQTQGTYKTYQATDIQTEKQLANWNFEKVWTISSDVNNGFPTLQFQGDSVSQSIYDPAASVSPSGVITTAAQLNQIRNDLSEDYVLGANIVLTGEWEPVGTKAHPFTGSLTTKDGASYTISGLKISSVAHSYAGLFGYVGSTAKLSGFTVEGTINKGVVAGLIAGYIDGQANNLGASGDIQMTGTSTTDAVGTAFGMAGMNAKVMNVSTSGSINLAGTGSAPIAAGGIVGTITSGEFTDVESTTSIVVSSAASTELSIGGIAGLSDGKIARASRPSSSTIQITGKAKKAVIGGIIGDNRGTVNTAIVTAIDISVANSVGENIYAGGVAGAAYGNGIIKQAKISAGKVEAYNAGGIIGYVYAETSDAVAVQACMAEGNVNVNGYRVAGIAAKVDKGVVNNCATFAKLNGSRMSGFAAIIEKPATVSYSFSAATFNLDAGKGYAVTESEIFQEEFSILGVFSGGGKVAGYFTNNIYDENLAAGTEVKHSSKLVLGADLGDHDDGATSTENCKKKATYDNRGFSKIIWDIVDGEYPTIKGIEL